jgi:hypothetical protein
MRKTSIGILCAACCLAAGAWGGDGRLPVSGRQNPASLLPVAKLDIAQMFEAADVNDDELVTFQEAHTYNFLVTQAQFDTYDTNLDGYIDRAEAGLPPIDPPDPGDGGCSGCSGCSSAKSLPAWGDLFTMALSLLGLAVMARVGRR